MAMSLENYQHIHKLYTLICEKSPFQKRSLARYLASKDAQFYEWAERTLSDYLTYLARRSIDIDYVAKSYLTMCNSILKEQIKFRRTGKYTYNTVEQAEQAVYSNREYMQQYMIGVAVSQVFWNNHHRMFEFFAKHLSGIDSGENYLEIGVGHGMFLCQALRSAKFESYTGVDISETSTAMARELVSLALEREKLSHLEFVTADVLDLALDGRFSFITMGEVLEHVERPLDLLLKIHTLLADDGRAYISTCTNAPVLDHIYLFSSVDEIRDMLQSAGLDVEDEILIPLPFAAGDNAGAGEPSLSYAAILSRRRNFERADFRRTVANQRQPLA